MSPRKVDNSERINVFFSPVVLEKLRIEASDRGTTVSGMVRMIVLDWLRKEDERDNEQVH